MKRVFAVFLCLCLLVPIMVQPTYAQGGMDLRETYPDCLERFSTDSFEESMGRMIPYNSESLMFSIRASGASFSFTPAPLSGNTACNAYRFVLANYTASNKMTVTYRYTDNSETYTSDCVLEQTQRTQTCLVYIPDAERVSRITVSFFGVRNGSVRLYSVNPVSAYEAIPTEYGTLSSCVANPSAGTVTLNGRVLSGVTARFTDAKLLLYRLPFGADPLTYLADETRTPLAELKIASKFTFTVPAETASDRLSRYIVTLKTSDGTETPLTGPTYVTSLGGEAVAGGELSGGSYKGVIGDETSTVISLGAGSTVVDVYLNRLLSDSQSPYSFTSGGTTIQIDRTYVADLDSRIRAYTASGATVYLRYLISASASDERFSVTGETDAKYKGILLSGNDSASLLYSVTDYLAGRYGNQAFGRIGGIILGSGIDDAKGYNDCGELSLDAYIRNYAQAVLTVRLALSKSGYGMKIVVPVTDRVSPELIGRTERDGKYDKYLLLSGLAKLFSESDFTEYTVLLESRDAPYRLSVSETGKLTPVAAPSGYYTAANVRDFENLLSVCGMGRAGYLFEWSPPGDLTDTELIVSYLYSYHALNRSGGPGALFLCVDRERLERFALVISRIDTEEGTGQENFVLDIFGVSSWQELLNRQKTGASVNKLVLKEGIAAQDAAGTYACFDFSSALGTMNWDSDPNVSGFGIGVSKIVGRALAATVDFGSDTSGGIYYTFTYPEDMTLYDSLAFCFAVEDLDDVRSVFELNLTLFGDGFVATGSVLAGTGTETECAFDTSSLPGNVRAIRVTVRSVSGSDSACRVFLRNITACSETLNSEELQSEIKQARKEAREDAERISDTLNPVGLTVLVILAVATVLLTLFLVRQSKHKKTS